MADYLIQDTTLDAIANAINAKTGGSSAMTPAQMVTAIGNIGGGSGVQALFTGTVTLIGQNSTSFSVPVSGVTLTGNEHIVGIGRAVRTGEMVDGDIEWYQNVTIPTFATSSNNAWSPHFLSNKDMTFPTAMVYNADGTVSDVKTSVGNNVYRIWQNNNGGITGGQRAVINTTNNSISIGAGSYSLCRTSCAVEYEYFIFIMCSNGTYY